MDKDWRNELITKGAAIDALGERPIVWDEWTDEYSLGQRNQYDDDKSAIEALPSAQPECTRECMPMYANVCDYISRRAALEAMDTWDKFGCDPDGKLVRYDDDKHYVPYVHYEDMVHAIKHLPSAQPDDEEANYWHEKANSYEHTLVKLSQSIAEQPQRINGRWETDSYPMDDGEYLMTRCTACGTAYEYGHNENYCGFCGADMRGDNNAAD